MQNKHAKQTQKFQTRQKKRNINRFDTGKAYL